MKGFEWLLEELDLNRITCHDDYAKFIRINKSVGYAEGERLIHLIARESVIHDNLELLTFAIVNGFDVNSSASLSNVPLIRHAHTYDCQRLLIDYGANVTGKKLLDRSLDFIKTRNLARSSAILTMYAMYEMDKKYKNVSKNIARVVWSLRDQTK